MSLVQLKEEVAKMRLSDLTKQYGSKSPRVISYSQRVGKTFNESEAVGKSLSVNSCKKVATQSGRDKREWKVSNFYYY